MRHDILICMGSSCFARGNGDHLELIERFLRENGIEAEVRLRGSRCEGACADGPNIRINGVTHHAVSGEMLLPLLEALRAERSAGAEVGS